jgi:hypothetical protein
MRRSGQIRNLVIVVTASRRVSVRWMARRGYLSPNPERIGLRDGDPRRYGGRGVLRAIANVTDNIAPKLIGMDAVGEVRGSNYRTFVSVRVHHAVSPPTRELKSKVADGDYAKLRARLDAAAETSISSSGHGVARRCRKANDSYRG